MNALKQGARVLALLGLAIMILIGATGTEAAMTNWTETLYTASSGGLDFTWDENSQYDLSYSKPTLKESPISINPDAGLVGTIYQFTIPNFYDPLPRKTVHITINGTNEEASGFELATVLDVFGSDAPYGEIGPSLPVQGHFVSGTTSPTTITQLWQILPNPDWESVKVWAPAAFELEAIQISTQSVPLPASILLLGSALAGLVVLRRKRTA